MATALSLVLPVHNEAAILERSVLAIRQHLADSPAISDYEILLVCNGCTDDSERIAGDLTRVEPERIRSQSIAARGLGHAIREGILAARHPTVMFYAVDQPFGLSIIDESIAALEAQPRSIVIGSKGHPQSRVARGAMRSLFSRAIATANRLLFGLQVKDTQGSLLLAKEIVERERAAMDSDGPFFQAQIVIYGHRMGYNVVEIPVRLVERGGDGKTRLKLAQDGLAYLADLAREKRKLMKEHRR